MKCKHLNVYINEEYIAHGALYVEDGDYCFSSNDMGRASLTGALEVACLDCEFEHRYTAHEKRPQWLARYMKQITEHTNREY